MFTTNDQGPAAQELAYLENVSSFFASAKPFGNIGEEKGVYVITFRTNAEFAPYAFRAEGGGYYVRTYKSDYIIMGDTGSRAPALLAHEFTHLVVTHAGLKLPIWLNEGLADFYSTVEMAGKQATIGRPPVRYLQTVRGKKWIPWDTLFAVDGSSGLYNEDENLAILYSQSWALTHMLALDERYSGHFKQFLQAVSAGQGSTDALQGVYHKNMAAIDADLSTYIRQRSLPVEVLDCPPEAPSPIPVISEAADFDVRLALANILSSRPATLSQGREKLIELAARYPERPEAEEALAMLALQQNNKDDARRHLALAVQRHSKDAQILFEDAVFEKEAGAKYGPVSALLRQALQIQPDLDQARLELGSLDYEDFQYKSALALLSSVVAVPADSRFEVYFTIAQCYVNLDDLTQAERYVKKAAQVAGTEDQKQLSADLLESVLRDETPEVPSGGSDSAKGPVNPEPHLTNVRGEAKLLQCSSGQRRLSVEVDGHEMVFDIDDPHLVVRHPNADYAHWSCGPLKAVTLTIVYMPHTGPGGTNQDTVGKALELVF